MSDAAVALFASEESFTGGPERPRVGRLLGPPSLERKIYYTLSLVSAEYRTGEDTQREPAAPVRNLFSRIELSEDSTGYGWLTAPLLRAYSLGTRASLLDETDTLQEHPQVLISTAPEVATRVRTPEGDAAARLRELSGLQIGKLADMFGVARPTYYNWLKGVRPRGEHRDHLLFALQLMEEAGRILGEPRNVGAWLIAPSTASGRIPIELLKNKQFDLCRALLTRGSGTRKALPARTKRRLSGQELRDAMERYSPRPSLEDLGLSDEPGEDVER
jgi:transcriptional regulator with XRE-family HTH domain